MAEKAVTHSSASSSDAPHHLTTNIESGQFDEEKNVGVVNAAVDKSITPPRPRAPPIDDEEEDEDMDALIDDLESQDGHEAEEDNGEDAAGNKKIKEVPESLLLTDTRIGLTEAEVLLRRKKYGMNQMKEEKQNMFLKFFGYFVGPIQFVMEVSQLFSSIELSCIALLFMSSGDLQSSFSSRWDFPRFPTFHLKIAVSAVSVVLKMGPFPPPASRGIPWLTFDACRSDLFSLGRKSSLQPDLTYSLNHMCIC